MKKRIVVAEQHGIMRDGLCALLNSELGLEVIGTASGLAEAVRVAERLQPDLLLVEMAMPMADAEGALAGLRLSAPGMRVLVLTFHGDQKHVDAALQAGANGYLLKNDSRMDMLAAVHAVLNGKTFLSPAICEGVVSAYLTRSHAARPERTTTAVGTEVLSQRERQVVKLIAEGYRTREIATRLALSHKTVEKHRSNLMRKLKLRSAAAVTAYAIANGFLQP